MKRKILYLYAKMTPYQVPVFKILTEKFDVNLLVVYWDNDGNAPYNPESSLNIEYLKRSEYNNDKLKPILLDFKPDAVVISGWQDWGYLPLVKPFKKSGVPIIAGFDDNWHGNLRQWIGALIFPFFLKNYFTHGWVSGPRQYEYAKRLGFKDSKILYYLYSGDTALFSKALEYLDSKAVDYPKTFLFVGRFAPAKAIDILAKGFKIYKDKYNGKWDMICIGKGPLKFHLENIDGIKIIDHSNQEKILELLNKVGVFILPSRRDVSPLVVHEFSSAGLPLILSNNIGNKLMFLIENFNGYSFKRNSPEDLARVMDLISQKSGEDLVLMGRRSHYLSKQHSSELVAASLMSIF